VLPQYFAGDKSLKNEARRQDSEYAETMRIKWDTNFLHYPSLRPSLNV
jgi:hypothetical protein